MTAVLFRGGTIFDGHRYAGAHDVLVVDGRIAAVDPDRVPAAAEPVELAGALLTPGFVDAHVHAVQGGLERIRCDLSGLSTREEYLASIAAYADAHPELPWIQGGGWAMSAFPGGTPTAEDLDRVVPDRPVFLPNRDHHGAWVNTRALELAGVDARTEDPGDGYFERDRDGRPTGTLHEGAMAVVGRLAPEVSEEEYYAALQAGQAYLHRMGVTGWQDAILGDYAGVSDPSETYLRAARNGDLSATVVGALWWDRERGLEQIDELIARRERFTHGRLRATSVKIMQDGVAENYTAALGTPYLDRCGHPTDNRGHSFVDGQALRRYVAALDAEGFQVHVHAIGDRGVREALDAFAGLDPERTGQLLRHHIAHLQIVHPEDVVRFGALGVTANCQAYWACYDDQMVELTLPFLGEERAAWQYPFEAIRAGGGPLAMGSDWPVSTPDPLQAIHVAVNRTMYDGAGPAGSERFLPEQALSLEAALAAYTSGSARVCHRDDAGVIAPGAIADLAVLDRDPFAGTSEEIGACQVVSTWVEGGCVS